MPEKPIITFDPDKARIASEFIKKNNIDISAFKGATGHVMSKRNPLEATGLETNYEAPTHEFDQGVMTDFMSGVWNSFIVGGGEGLANLVPTIAQAAGSESEIFSNWKTNVSDWFKEQETVYSDKANLPIEEFSDITASHTASALGQGVGFILGIMGGGGAIGSFGKGATTLSKISSATKLMNATEKAAYLAKNADVIAKAEKGAKLSNRIGSFISGTTLMYPSIDKEAKEAGLSDVDASRFALGVSGIVSMTEGAALEWIGKIATKPLTGTLTSQAVKETLKNAKTKNPVELQKLFLENFSKKMGSNIAKISESATVEFGQEFSQTYIEEGAKQLWDSFGGKDKGKFGSDVTTYKTFVEATYGGIIGAIIGGGMGASHIAKSKMSGVVDSDESSLLNQSLFGYINTSVQNKNFKNIENLEASVDTFVQKGELSKEEAIVVKENIANLTSFAKDYNTASIKDNTALYQLFQLDNTKKSISEFNESLSVSENANETVKKAVEQKKSKIDMVKERVQENFDYIFERGKSETKNKEKFDEKLLKYKNVLKEINENNIDEETINKKLDGIFNPKIAKEESKKAAETQKAKKDFGKVYNVNDTVTLTDAALNDKEGFEQAYNDIINNQNKPEAMHTAIQAMQDKYGLDPESAQYLIENMEFQSTPDIKVEEKTEDLEDKQNTKPLKLYHGTKKEGEQGVVFSVEKDYKNILELPEDQLEHLKELADKGDEKAVKILDSENKYLEADKYMDELYADKYDAIKYNQKSSKKPVEYYDIKDKKFYSVDEKYAKIVGSLADRSMKYRSIEQKPTSTEEQETTTELKPTEVAKEEVKEAVQEVKQEDSLIKESDENLIKETEEVTEEEKSKIDALQKAAEQKAKDDKLTDDEIANKKGDAIFDILDEIDEDVKEQRKSNDLIYEQSLVRDNPELYNKIKEHFKKIFPHIPVSEINELGEKYGATILARLVERGIEIDPTKAIQTSLIHEYAHIYLEVLGDNHPLVKLGYEMIEGTQFDLDAKRLYPDKIRQEQLNEALTEVLATNSLDKLKVKFEGSTLEKFKEFAKRFWARIKRFFTGPKSSNVIDILADGLILKNKPFSVGLSSLVGVNKNQLKQIPDARFVKNLDTIQSAFNILKLNATENKTEAVKINNSSDASKIAFGSLLKLYNREKSGNDSSNVKLFEGIELGEFTILKHYTGEKKLQILKDFSDALKDKAPKIYDDTQQMVSELSKLDLDTESLEGTYSEEQAQDEDKSGAMSNVIKNTKKLSPSLKSLLTSILDYNGKLINPDLIVSYVSHASENSYKIDGLVSRLENDAKNGNLMANRLLSTINGLPEQRKIGFLQALSSLIQVESEAANIQITKDSQGRTKYRLTNPTVNKLKELGGIKDNLLKSKTIDEVKSFFNNMKDNGYFKAIVDGDVDMLQDIANKLSFIFDNNITVDDVIRIRDNFPPGKTNSKLSFAQFLGGDYSSIKSFLNGKNKKGDIVDYKDISGYIERIFNETSDITPLANNFLNGQGNAESSTQLGHWVSELNSMLINPISGRLKAMKNSPIYKNNTVLDYFSKGKKIKYAKLDTVKNLNTNEVVDYANLNANDYHITQLFKFATNVSSKFYKQSIGVISNRDGMLLFEVPTYTNEKLKEAYKQQAKDLESLLKTKLIGLDSTQQKKLISDFNNLYIHKADKNGKVTSAMEIGHTKEIDNIKSIVSKNGLTEALSSKVNNGTFKNFDELLSNYFYTEALNRSYLSDIYAGPALHHSKPNSKKGAVESFIKRMSGINSNGTNIELKKPVTFVVYKGKSKVDGVKLSDSFAFFGNNINKEIKDATGSFSPVGINSKNNIFQVDPITGEQLYVKSSNLNVTKNEGGSTNMDGMTDKYTEMAQALSKIEDYLGDNVNIVLVDADAFKGTYSGYEAIDLNELLEAVKNDKIDSIKDKFSKPVQIYSLKTPFNLNKKLPALSKQEAVLGIQVALLQFNNASAELRNKFQEKAIRYLNEKMGGDYELSKTFLTLKDFNAVVESLSKDLNDREKSITTEILEAVKEYNKANPDNEILSFDNPNIRLIYEQHVSSQLSKKGIKIDLPGNFLHQLPDIGDTLEYDEVAVPWKMFANSLEEANELLKKGDLRVAVVRIPTSAEVSVLAGKVKYFLNTDENVAMVSNGFVKTSDSDHDGDKVMVYRQEIDDKGNIRPFTLQSQMFDLLYNNLKSEQFVSNALNNTLDLNVLKEAIGSEIEADYKSGSIDAVVDVAQKMGLGQEATGRFAIASKLMSLLSQSGSYLHKAIKYKGKEYKEFTNKELNNLAVLLQSALDIGNNPILTETGFTKTTIDTGNAMILLGIDVKDVIGLLKSKSIQSLNNKFNERNSVYNESEKISFKEFLNEIKFLNGKPRSSEEIAATFGQEVADFINFNEVANDLSKVISFIQLDKSLPNNSISTNNLLDTVKEFKDLSFDMTNIMNRPLYKHTKKMLELQSDVYATNLITSSPLIKKLVKSIGESLTNQFTFNKAVDEQVLHYLAQHQLSTQRVSPSKFITDLSNKMHNIYRAVVLNETEVEVAQHVSEMIEAGSNFESVIKNYEGTYTRQQMVDDFNDYVDMVTVMNQADMFKGNSVFDYLQFKEDDNGKLVMSLKPDFKATSETKQKFKDDFKEIQALDPELARDIIDYQLYRFGFNNKIGSFIDGMPTDLHVKSLVDTTKLINNPSLLSSMEREIAANLIGKNSDLVKVVTDKSIVENKYLPANEIILKDDKYKLVKYNDVIYTRIGQSTKYSKFNLGKFETNNNFTAYNIDKKLSAVTKEDIEEIKKCIPKK